MEKKQLSFDDNWRGIFFSLKLFLNYFHMTLKKPKLACTELFIISDINSLDVTITYSQGVETMKISGITGDIGDFLG